MAPKKNCKNARAETQASASRTRITRTVLDRLIKEKMARTRDCDGVSAMPVVRSEGASGGANWRVPGYTGDGSRVSKCEAAIRDYIEFLATQFDVEED